ncbi:Transcriptional regulator [Hahella chejuensis KCTC 2396]|uniref:Transcriptional regulator n=1 Tax=Hahella chejuensis (strain KCTC 2396) TaxID=349521 RepID=Q2SAP5_HAHCH|nr:TetR/AcrR family transcriptional regulator [Hahella chejuensis]ABC32279.1 Transcriptional regulator [Hahella chejuensis KCTC 2396]
MLEFHFHCQKSAFEGGDMRYKAGQKEETRKRIMQAAGRSFRKNGFSGIGVDGLAKEAGVTSGAFYGHFKSKKEAFEAAVTSGLRELGEGVTHFREQYGDEWWSEFAKFYMQEKRTCDLAESCALQSLTSEVGRSEADIRTLFQTELLKVVLSAQGNENSIKQGTERENLDKVWARLAMLIGGVTLARAVADEELASSIAAAIERTIETHNGRGR